MRTILPRWLREVLRLVAIAEVLAQRQEQVVVRRLRDAAAEMIAARRRALLAEDHAGPGRDGASSASRARASAVRAAAVRRLGVAEIDGAVLREAAIDERRRCRPPWPDANTRGTPASGGDELAVARGDAQPAGPLGDQHVAVRQERQRPGMRKPADHGLDRELAGRRLERLRGGVRRRQREQRRPAQASGNLMTGSGCDSQACRSASDGGALDGDHVDDNTGSPRLFLRQRAYVALPDHQHRQQCQVGDVEGDAGRRRPARNSRACRRDSRRASRRSPCRSR